jgi:hypothetical protein
LANNQCENCPYNNLDQNIYKQGDAIVVGQDVKQYCFMFDNGIPDDILTDKKKCEFKQMSK